MSIMSQKINLLPGYFVIKLMYQQVIYGIWHYNLCGEYTRPCYW